MYPIIFDWDERDDHYTTANDLKYVIKSIDNSRSLNLFTHNLVSGNFIAGKAASVDSRLKISLLEKLHCEKKKIIYCTANGELLRLVLYNAHVYSS